MIALRFSKERTNAKMGRLHNRVWGLQNLTAEDVRRIEREKNFINYRQAPLYLEPDYDWKEGRVHVVRQLEGKSLMPLEQRLENMGENGWELVGITPPTPSGQFFFLFKRPRS